MIAAAKAKNGGKLGGEGQVDRCKLSFVGCKATRRPRQPSLSLRGSAFVVRGVRQDVRVGVTGAHVAPLPAKLDAEVQYCVLVRQAGRASEVGCQPTQKVFWAADERG
jgi:hypothetical protein